MAISANARLDEQAYFVQATTMSSDWTAATWVSMKNWRKLIIVADALTTGTVSGGVVTLNQATDVSAGSAKALGFKRRKVNVGLTTAQTEAAQLLTETTVTSDTWTIPSTTGKRYRSIMEVNSEDLDIAGGFDCVRFVSTALVNATGVVNYILIGARYDGATAMID